MLATSRIPPFISKTPLVGNLLELARDPVALCQRGYAEHGSVFGFKLGPKTAIGLVGPEHHDVFFRETDDSLSFFEAMAPMRKIAGDFGYGPTPNDHKRMRQSLAPLISRDGMARYAQIIHEEADAAFASMGQTGQFQINDLFWRMSLTTGVRRIYGDGAENKSLARIFHLYKTVFSGLSFFLPSNLPLPKFIRRDRALREIRKMIHDDLASPREPNNNPDLLSHFAQLMANDSEWKSEDVHSVLFLLMAVHETLGTFAAWSLIVLLQHPHYLERVRQDIARSDASQGSRDDAAQIPSLDLLMREVERLHPPVIALMRIAVRDTEIAGYQIRKGWHVMVFPSVSHRLPSVFSNPDAFDPDRFLPERDEGGQHKYPLVAFGAGAHACLGRPLVLLATRIMLTRLIREFDLSLVGEARVDTGHALRRPRDPCSIRYTRRA